MTQRKFVNGLCAALALLCLCAPSSASENRETPLVRAVKRAKSCVVNIHSEKTAHKDESLFPNARDRKVSGMGTGIILDERGYIATNYHVVAKVDSLRASLSDGGTYDARVIAYDREHDLAIIKIDASAPLKVMPMGTSSDLMLGESVFAVGNAFGYEDTVTSGIVSSLSRDVEVNETQSYENLIQTDASINPGNSGGPLLNLEGEVVGINVAIRANAQRIGFAIPIDDARKVLAKLMSIEQLNSHYHGLVTTDKKSGATRELVVDAAMPDSPAAKAGFKAGDVVLKAGTVDVVDGVDLERALLGRNTGEVVDVTVKRNDKTETLKIQVAQSSRQHTPAYDSQVVVRGNTPEFDPGDEISWRALGLKLTQVASTEPSFTGSRYHGGMRVVEVQKGGPAEINGIRQGDILVGLHLWETVNAQNVSWVLEHPEFSNFNPLKFYILRGHETLFGHIRASVQTAKK
jgi:serine protease Do